MAIFDEPLFGKKRHHTDHLDEKARTCVSPKKGMLVTLKFWSRKRDFAYENQGVDPEGWFLIVRSYVDEYGRCKFEFLSDKKTHWTEWMSIKEFNSEFMIKNPWI